MPRAPRVGAIQAREFLNGSPPRRSLLDALGVEVETVKSYRVKGKQS